MAEHFTNCLCSTAKFIGKHGWRCCENLIKLDQNMDKLEEDIKCLSDLRDVTEGQLLAVDPAHKIKRKDVVTWLEDVGRTKKDVEEFQGKVEGSKDNICKRLCLAQQVQGKIDKVAKVKEKGKFPDGLVIDPPRPKGTPMSRERGFSEAASARNFEKVWNCLIDDKFTKIGVVGMGGAGKTTIMKEINNAMIKQTADSFDEVIWVTVSKVAEGSITGKIQDSIAKHFFPKEDDYENNWKPKDGSERERVLCTKFSQKRYLLILDDVWETFRLDKIGVDETGVTNSTKVTLVLTTRLKKVPEIMGCEIVEVDLLTEKEANDLFMETIALGVNKLTPEVESIVKTIVKKCRRLPLAIMTISRNMRTRKDVDAWREKLDQISRKEIKDEYADVFEVLRFSYDRLKNEKLKLKECFLYCALYLEDHDISRNELIEYWIVEELIDEMDSREAMFDRGRRILNELIDANLLEGADEKSVRVHDLIREMSLKIIGTRFYSGDQVFEEVPFEVWSQDREKVFLNNNQIRVLPRRPLCPQLTTLLLRGNFFLESIPDSFFSSVPRLKVLDLSHTKIRSLPKSVSDLENLHALLAGDCYMLEYVPSLQKLTELKELDLCNSNISEVPEGLEELVNLRNLDLFNTQNLEPFDSWKLRKLSKLQRLRVDSSKVKVSAGDLSRLNKLEVVCAEFKNGGELFSYLGPDECQRLKKYRLYADPRVNRFSRGLENFGNVIWITNNLRSMEQCSQGKSAKRICNFGKRIGSEGWTWGSQFRTRRLPVDYSSCSRGESGLLRAGLGMDWERLLTGSSLGGEQWTQNWYGQGESDCFIKQSVTVTGRQVLPDNVETLRLEGCNFDINIGSSDNMPWKNAKDLRDFILWDCSGIELIFSENCQAPLRSVEELTLHVLPDLRVLFHEVAPAGDISFKLKSLFVVGCSGIKNIFPAILLQNNFPNLEELSVSSCENVKEIIVDEDVEMRRKTVTLPNLRSLRLRELPALKSIYKGTMVSTSLHTIHIWDCPELKRLPFSCSNTDDCQQQVLAPPCLPIMLLNCPVLKMLPFSCLHTDDDCQQHASPLPALRHIIADNEWWESLEWDDDHTKAAFQRS